MGSFNQANDSGRSTTAFELAREAGRARVAEAEEALAQAKADVRRAESQLQQQLASDRRRDSRAAECAGLRLGAAPVAQCCFGALACW